MNAPVTPLVDAATLADELAGDCAPVLLDARWRLGGPPGADSYLAGHLPGAVFADLDRDLAGPPGAGGRHPLPDAAVFQAAMRRAGVSTGRPVVAYDDGDSIAAARAWWTLRYFGHDQVRVLDGGFSAWVAAGLPVTTDGPAVTGEAASAEGPAAAQAPRARPFTAVPGGMPVLDADGAAELARAGVLLDARTGERYRGEAEPVDPVAGHIPGALSAPVAGSMSSDGRFRSPAELAERFAALGVMAGRPAGAYCGSGVTAAHEVLALALAGVPATLYVGSWSGWIADPGRPVATGPEPG
jgi:thiosulfate/3-mercaptopyruvate sulfurtransferase